MIFKVGEDLEKVDKEFEATHPKWQAACDAVKRTEIVLDEKRQEVRGVLLFAIWRYV
jgi:hypothetical protein